MSKKYIFSFLSLSCFLLGVLFVYYYSAGPLTKKKKLIIPQYSSTTEIIKVLYNENIIICPLLFKLIIKILNLQNHNVTPKCGEYEFHKKISPKQVIVKIISGNFVLHKLVIPEHFNVTEIIAKLNSNKLLVGTVDDSLIPEGSLFPATYFYFYGEEKSSIIRKMQNKMCKEINDAMQYLKSDSPIKTPQDLLILASIIEKEAYNDSEKDIISSVFINRLKKGMKLQSDPTVIYAITNGKYKLNRKLFYKDLKIQSRYNTYFIKGLPKGPICCPSKSSLLAAAKPAKTNFLYFVTNAQNIYYFSSNFAEHKLNIRKIKTQLEENTKNR